MMRKELILFLSGMLMLNTLNSEVNAKDINKVQNHTSQVTFPFDDDPFFQFNDDVFNQMRIMQQAMNRLMQSQFAQINNKPIGLANSKDSLSASQAIQMEERNNELIYKIKQPQGNDSKVDVSVKDGILIINTHFIQKTSRNENGSKSYSFSQSNYNQSFKLPKDYDPDSIDIKQKDANLIVTFKKQNISNSLKI